MINITQDMRQIDGLFNMQSIFSSFLFFKHEILALEDFTWYFIQLLIGTLNISLCIF